MTENNLNTGQQQLTIDQAIQVAEQHHASGNLQQAEILLRQILQAQPEHAPSMHLMGIIAHQSGHIDMAIKLISEAVRIQSDIPLFHANLCEMLRQNGQLDKALTHGEQSIKLDPRNAAALSNLGIICYDQGDLGQAEKYQKKALVINPSLVAALNNLGSICRDRKDYDVAEQYYRQVLSISPNYLETMNNLGSVLTEKEQPEQALEYLNQALRLKPDYADAHHNIAITWLMLEQDDKAELSFNQELNLVPDKPGAYAGLAQIYLNRNESISALNLAKKAWEMDPLDAKVHVLLADIYAYAGEPSLAETSYAEAIKLDSNLESAFVGKGQLLMEQGKIEAAKDIFLHAQSINPGCIEAKLSLVQASKMKLDDPDMISLIQEAENLDGMLEGKAMSLHFALGKCYDDTKQYDLAFQSFQKACQIRRKRLSYSADVNELNTENIRKCFTPDYIEALRGSGCLSASPIFVLGMPRSGTTLVEQIISSHHDVHGAGELPDLLNLARNANGLATSSSYPQSMKGMTKDALRNLGENYVKGLQARSPESKHITDKMPANFSCIGLIHLMLPNAKIIHIRRNPVDTCLSNFTKLFGHKSQPHSYVLSELGRYYRSYSLLMDHWHKVLPQEAFLDVQYEDLVMDNEKHVREIIRFCELEWDEACLNFHKNKRIVKTASITQVRQPIYTSSIERWRNYEKHLGSLLEALGDVINYESVD